MAFPCQIPLPSWSMVILLMIPFSLFWRMNKNINNALNFLDTFCQAYGSAIQWHKMLCCHQSFLRSLPWLNQLEWKWVMYGEIFHFLGIPFSFQVSLVDLWNVVLAKITKKLEYWFMKPLSLSGKF